jgi:signal peptidase II
VRTEASRAWWLAAALCLLVVVIDQGSKGLVEHNLAVGEEVDGLGPLGLTLAHNRGVAFGLGGGGGVGLILLTLLALVFVVYVFARDPRRPGMWIAAGLVTGGALGNLIDRVRLDRVTDFIDVPPWPPFNLADTAIVAGVILLAVVYGKAERT